MSGKPRFWIQALVAVALVAAGAAGLAALTLSRPPLVKRKPKPVLPVVRTIRVEPQAVTVEVPGEGTVRPLHRSTLSTQVSGTVVYLAPELLEQGRFRRGQVLARIEAVDYELAVTLARARVREAETAVQKIRAEAEASVEEWRRIKGRVPPPPLVARRPQVAEAEAKLAAARAQLAQAELNLKRTAIRAPFAGRVIRRYADLGQYLRPGERVAEVFSTEAAEVVVNLEDRDLAWIRVPGFTPGEGPGSPVVVRAHFAGRELSWPGRVVRVEGELDPATRMVPVVVRVERPYARRPPLAMGLFVEVVIRGRTLPAAVRLPRAALRPGDVVWVVSPEGVLRFRKVRVARLWREQALITEGLEAGERVVVSPLEVVTDGMRVRLAPPAPRAAKAGRAGS
jgi:RND family efflux transporter MFP subunit